MNFDHIRLAFPIALPELMVEHLAREDLILVPDKQFQERNFRRREPQFFAFAKRPPCGLSSKGLTK